MQSHVSTLVLVLVLLQPSLATFCNYTGGGFANRSPGPCGSRTPTACGGALDGYANTRCCPSNSRCDIRGGNAYCCWPDAGDCASRVADAAKCADPWSKLWHFRDTPPSDSWCCDETHVGVAVFNSHGAFVAAACAPSAARSTLAPVTAGYFQTTATRPASTCTGAAAPSTSGTASKTPATDSAAASDTGSAATRQHAVLSKAGIAGIVVGCVAGVVLVGVASWFVLLFRRTPRRQVGGAAWTSIAPGAARRSPWAELGGAQRQDPVHELGT